MKSLNGDYFQSIKSGTKKKKIETTKISSITLFLHNSAIILFFPIAVITSDLIFMFIIDSDKLETLLLSIYKNQ